MSSIRTYRGFTIVEILISIVIIAALAAITVVAYNGVQARARNSKIASCGYSAGEEAHRALLCREQRVS